MRLRIPQRNRIYLGCEGESEQSYGRCLNGITDNLGLHLHIDCDVLQPGGGDPLALIETAIKHIRQKVISRGPFVHCAIILDADKLRVSPDRDAQIPCLAASHGIHLIWQNPCHEGFLLRHLPRNDTIRPQTSELALRALKGIWPGYRKGAPASALASWIDAVALRRAAAVEPDLRSFLSSIGLFDGL
jgi:hypothetical protein